MNDNVTPTRSTRRLPLARVLLLGLALLSIATGFGAARADALPWKPPPTDFHYMTVSSDGSSITADFDYDGGPHDPVMNVGTTSDVYSHPAGWSKAVRIADHRMRAKVTGLQPGTQYYLRIDNTRSTAYGSARTFRRDVDVDINQIRVMQDGDSGPRGCGDFSFTFKVMDDETFKNDVCLDDGEHWESWQIGNHFHVNLFNHKVDTARVVFHALDNDTMGSVWSCGGPTSNACGDMASATREWATAAPGIHQESITVFGQGVQVQARALVTVTYTAW